MDQLLVRIEAGKLERNAEEVESGAGQYFTSRALIDAMTEVVAPKIGETLHARPAAPAASCSRPTRT